MFPVETPSLGCRFRGFPWQDVGKPISIESIEEMPSYVTIVTDLAQVGHILIFVGPGYGGGDMGVVKLCEIATITNGLENF